MFAASLLQARPVSHRLTVSQEACSCVATLLLWCLTTQHFTTCNISVCLCDLRVTCRPPCRVKGPDLKICFDQPLIIPGWPPA